MASSKPVVYEVASPYTEVIAASPYVASTSSQYIARNFNGYSTYVDTPVIAAASLPYTSLAYSSYVL
jgi:hypothetical protein